ncbi:MotA/TolQ/ExbB proton channel family protein [Marinicellulosiphila megalodicopiae]|uniref:MotA/TolQ/ExbB proton channel family protein n=1 Tax=Marinicellulosiphila megalodicopiae TaxID=2724896 RepID=UPI003BB17EF6
MEWMIALEGFFNKGGNVLWLIFFVATCLWMLCLERFLYLWVFIKQDEKTIFETWKKRSDHTSWFALQIKENLNNQLIVMLQKNIKLIATLIALCPLFGLLGTVTGMIEVFDGMSVNAAADAKSMASGVSKATIPTMTGMSIALFGLIMKTFIDRKVEQLTHKIEIEK